MEGVDLESVGVEVRLVILGQLTNLIDAMAENQDMTTERVSKGVVLLNNFLIQNSLYLFQRGVAFSLPVLNIHVVQPPRNSQGLCIIKIIFKKLNVHRCRRDDHLEIRPRFY